MSAQTAAIDNGNWVYTNALISLVPGKDDDSGFTFTADVVYGCLGYLQQLLSGVLTFVAPTLPPYWLKPLTRL